jgi:hypothetical protein
VAGTRSGGTPSSGGLLDAAEVEGAHDFDSGGSDLAAVDDQLAGIGEGVAIDRENAGVDDSVAGVGAGAGESEGSAANLRQAAAGDGAAEDTAVGGGLIVSSDSQAYWSDGGVVVLLFRLRLPEPDSPPKV